MWYCFPITRIPRSGNQRLEVTTTTTIKTSLLLLAIICNGSFADEMNYVYNSRIWYKEGLFIRRQHLALYF